MYGIWCRTLNMWLLDNSLGCRAMRPRLFETEEAANSFIHGYIDEYEVRKYE